MSADAGFSSWEDAVRWLRAQPDRAELVRAAYYDDPLLAATQRYEASDEWRAIRTLLPAARGAALDVGAGRGIASYTLARHGYAVSALEPDPSALVGSGAIRALAAAAALPIDVVEDYSERLPFDDARFDLVFARAVLHHTRDLEAACREYFRVLKPGGRLVAVREHVISRHADLPAFLQAHPLHALYGGEHAYTRAEYTRAIRGAGFRLTRVLRPLASPINYFPQTAETLRRDLAARLVPWRAPRALLAALLLSLIHI